MKSSTFTERNNKLRSEVTQFFKKHCLAFSYKGRAIHVGHWETSTDSDKLLDLTKPNGDVERAAFRLVVHFPNEHGIPIHVKMCPASYLEWETVFNGYIANIRDLVHVLGFQLGIPLQNIFKRDSLGNVICPHGNKDKPTKARCIGCLGCEFKDLILFETIKK